MLVYLVVSYLQTSPKEHRQLVIDEILETERAYIDKLTILATVLTVLAPAHTTQHYIAPLSQNPSILSPIEVNFSFPKFRDILAVHQELLIALEQANQDPSGPFASVFFDYVCVFIITSD
jgi:hypothetical protein